MLQFPSVTMRKNTLISIIAACMLLGTAACVGTASKGEARVVVMPISGSRAANGAVTEVVESRYELVSARRYAKTARELSAKSKAEEDVRKVSRKLNIDALVHGEFVKRGKRKYVLRLSLRAGASGAEFQSVTIKLRSKKLSDKDRSKIQKKLSKALAEVDTWSQDDSSDDDRSSRGRRSADNDDKERERARKLRKKQHEKDMRKEEKRLARADRDRKKSRSDDEMDEEDEIDDEDDRKSRSRKSFKSESKKATASKSSKSESKKKSDGEKKPESKNKSESSKTAKKSSKDDEKDEDRSRSAESKKTKKTKKDESYKVITVRDDDGQALDTESPF